MPAHLPSPPPRRRQGGAALELALTLPLMVMLGGAVIEWGWFFVRQRVVLEAAADAVRTAAGTLQEDDPEAAGAQRARWLLAEAGLRDATVGATLLTDDALGLQVVRVDVSAPYEPLIGLFPLPESLTASATMSVADQPE